MSDPVEAARGETRAADGKANALLTAAAVIVTAQTIAAAVDLPPVPRALLALSVAPVVAALVLLLLAIRPRTDGYGELHGEDEARMVYQIAKHKYRVIRRAVDALVCAVALAGAAGGALLAAYLV